MKWRKKHYKVGDYVKVKHCWSAYLLPEGLPDGATVKVVGMDVRHDDVEYKNRLFRISTANVDCGWEYFIDGKWRDEDDPKVLAEVARWRTTQTSSQSK